MGEGWRQDCVLIIEILLFRYRDQLLGYSVEFSGDTVRVLAEINHYVGSGPHIPGLNEYFFPFGIILQSPARPER